MQDAMLDDRQWLHLYLCVQIKSASWLEESLRPPPTRVSTQPD